MVLEKDLHVGDVAGNKKVEGPTYLLWDQSEVRQADATGGDILVNAKHERVEGTTSYSSLVHYFNLTSSICYPAIRQILICDGLETGAALFSWNKFAADLPR